MSLGAVLGRIPGAGAVRGLGRTVRRGATRALEPVVEPLVDEAVRERLAGERIQEAAPDGEASEAAIRKAQELGVDLSDVQGTGADGMVTVRDVLRSGGGSE